MKKLLNVEDISRSSEGAGLKNHGNKLRHVFVRKHANDLQLSFDQALLAQKEKTKAQSKYAGETVLKVFFLFLKQNLCDGFGSILVT